MPVGVVAWWVVSQVSKAGAEGKRWVAGEGAGVGSCDGAAFGGLGLGGFALDVVALDGGALGVDALSVDFVCLVTRVLLLIGAGSSMAGEAVPSGGALGVDLVCLVTLAMLPIMAADTGARFVVVGMNDRV